MMGARLLMDEAGDGKGGGGGAGGDVGKPDPAKELADLKAERDALKAERDALKAKGGGDGGGKGDDPSLAEKARLEKEQKEKRDNETKSLESAVSFNLGAKGWLKENASLLPESIPGIFELAEKEKFDSAQDKASTIKVNLVTEFFSKQANLDLLTATQKKSLEDFLALTKNVRQERVQQIYDGIFEPTLETLRKLKKAEALQKGLAEPSDAEDAYAKKLMNLSRKHHLREKQ